jgi:hypothetical protein
VPRVCLEDRATGGSSGEQQTVRLAQRSTVRLMQTESQGMSSLERGTERGALATEFEGAVFCDAAKGRAVALLRGPPPGFRAVVIELGSAQARQ